MTTNTTALVLGATGGIGGEVARQLLARGWQVRALHRNPDTLSDAQRKSGVVWARGDAMSAPDVAAAAAGVSVIVHAVNPPGYRNWGKLVLPMLENTIAAARANGARIVLPGTVYNFGPDAMLQDLREDAPQHPVTAKGRIRAEMERRLREAASTGVRVLIVRAGDFFGPNAANNWFSQALVKPGLRVSKITYPGQRGIGHQWAYLPDVAETMVRLLERPDLETFAVFHMRGHWDADGTEMIEAIRRNCGNPNAKIAATPWRLMRLLSPFVPLFRELGEMRYLWRQPVRMNNSRLTSVLGAEPHTALNAAVRSTLRGLGCLDGFQ